MDAHDAADRRSASPGTILRRTMVVAVAAGALAACGRDLPTERAAAPAAPSQLLNPLCTAGGGTTHAAATITTQQYWERTGNPHHVTGKQVISTGGGIRVRQGTVVCFDYGTGVETRYGGHWAVDGRDTAIVVLTATDPALGWDGVRLFDTPSATSFMAHALVEYVDHGHVAVRAEQDHVLVLDSIRIRQSGAGVHLYSPGSRILHSRVDTTTNTLQAAVMLGDSTRFTQTVVLDAAGTGVWVTGSGVELLGGRIEGSGGLGLLAFGGASLASAQPVRITGSGGYPVEASVQVLARVYNTEAEQDSLLGNVRDTLGILGGDLASAVWVRADLPWRVKNDVRVHAGGSLRAAPGATLTFNPTVAVFADSGRIIARGSQAAPVLFTAHDPAQPWGGLKLTGTPSSISFMTNVRVEHTAYSDPALSASDAHPVDIDSAVFRRTGSAVMLRAAGSRLRRTRVDTTLSAYAPAVTLDGDVLMESTLVRVSSAWGVWISSPDARVTSCEIRGSVLEGILLVAAVEVHNCNLVDNVGDGIENADVVSADVENNWWGDAAGPTGASGDGAAGLLDYTPWRTTPYVLPYVP